ncbi:MAG TPA: transporter [Aromatoleum sp.]|uniref:SphA family protein n=1 Tax=Aromatoleum sp. TaxID=2307007 RepID=UPI002B4908D5|nr:transporter [Aromatoleum sp.]HJV25793.1 transporter [Aromatoleum sp.]
MRLKHICVAVALTGAIAGSAWAKEGADQYPHGGENWFAGALPPPGDYFLNYFGYYNADNLRDGDGHKVDHTGVTAWFDALRYVKVTNTQILGGNWAMHAIVPLVHQKVTLGDSKTVSGLGDIVFSPLVISWHAGNWHWAAALDIYAPTGEYKSGDPRKSIGANYWSVEPVFAATWLNEAGWELSAKFMYNIKAKNKDFRPAPGAPKMEYESGDEFHMDYLLGKRFGQWGVGLSGYYVKQTTDDKLDGDTLSSALGPWSSGRKGEVFAIGPSVSYTTQAGTMLIGQWQHESGAENRFQGDKLWFRLIMPF